MTTLTQTSCGQDVVECSFPVSSYKQARTLKDRNLVCEKASALDVPVNSPESIKLAKELFNGMSDADRQKTFKRLGVVETLERIGYEPEFCDSWDRRTAIGRNGRLER